jgi:hypothetical protein
MAKTRATSRVALELLYSRLLSGGGCCGSGFGRRWGRSGLSSWGRSWFSSRRRSGGWSSGGRGSRLSRGWRRGYSRFFLFATGAKGQCQADAN